MSRFLNARYAGLTAYTPGEQPRDRQYIKLNTNESPYPPSPAVLAALDRQDVADLRLYSDPEGTALRAALAQRYGVTPGQVFLSNGSDDILNFAFMAFGADGAVFPGLTYSFYPVFADLHQVAYETVPLAEDFSIDPAALAGRGKLTVLANPNAPTGLALSLDQVEAIVAADPAHVVVVDEAYVDFGADSAASLVDRYDNLLVVMTYSKSRSMAGARLGFALGSRALIEDLEKLKYSTDPEAGPGSGGLGRLLPGQGPADHGHPGQDGRSPAGAGLCHAGLSGELSLSHPSQAGWGGLLPPVQGTGHPHPPLL